MSLQLSGIAIHITEYFNNVGIDIDVENISYF